MTISVAHPGAHPSARSAPTVISVPADHVSVCQPGLEPSCRLLDPYWVGEADFDVYHLHVGFEGRSPGELGELVRTLRRTGRPFVHTVHQLRTPHRADRSLHDAQLDVLVPAADHLITFTPGAASEIQERWGREADVLPHPHVVDLEEIALARVRRSRRSTQEFRVGLYLQAKLANQDPAAVLPGLLRVIDELPGAVLQVDCDHELLDPGPREDPDLATALRRLADHGRIDLRTREPFTVRELVAYLDTIDLSVLPYRFGTHSAWLEACRDVGVTVLAPSCGYFHEQGPVLTYPLDEHRMDADSLQAAVRQAWEHRPHLGATVDERRVQRRRIEEHHSSLYRRLVRR